MFRDSLFVELHSFTAPNGNIEVILLQFQHFSLRFSRLVASGSFIYDVDLKIDNWTPTKEELMVLSAKMHRFDPLKISHFLR